MVVRSENNSTVTRAIKAKWGLQQVERLVGLDGAYSSSRRIVGAQNDAGEPCDFLLKVSDVQGEGIVDSILEDTLPNDQVSIPVSCGGDFVVQDQGVAIRTLNCPLVLQRK